MIVKKYYKLIRVSYADEGYFCLTNVSNGVGTVKIDNRSGTSGGEQPNFEYSTDGVAWNSYTTRGTEIDVYPDSNIYWRYAGSGGTVGGANQFYFNFDCYASGNLMSLYEKTNFASYTGNWDASNLFDGQTHLLRAGFNLGMQTTIPERGMEGMFKDCTSLVTPPVLRRITSVGESGMCEMFKNCTSLTTAPDLSNITSVGESGMCEMYQGCSSLSEAYAPTITWDTSKTKDWLSGVSSTGKLYADYSIASGIPTSDASGCPAGWTVEAIHDYPREYFTITNESDTDNTIYMGPKDSTNYKSITVYVSTDNGANWNEKSIAGSNVSLATLEPGKSLLVKHTGALSESGKYNAFGSDGNYSVSGNIASLCFGDNFNTGSALTMPDYAYTRLFSYNSTQAARLVSVENLDFSSYVAVSARGIQSMFFDCTSLTTPPDLSNITSVGTYGMQSMFKNCTSLKTAPDLSRITSVGEWGMQYMFDGCTSLVTAPDLSSITSVGNYGMQNMFENCTSLKTAPDLRKITSVGSYGMQYMYSGCSSLSEAYAPTITWDTNKTMRWLSGVSSTGKLYARSSIASSIPTSSVSGCPNGWTIVTI